MSKYKEHISQLRAQAWFQAMVKEEVAPKCPKVPAYHPDLESSDWEYGSGMRDGYILALKHMGIIINE